MSDFKTGGVPAPDYDSDDINFVYKKSEFFAFTRTYGVYIQTSLVKSASHAQLTCLHPSFAW